MNFVLIRVDNRLVHGQILEGWLPALDASSIIVVDDDVASDVFMASVIKMSVPKTISASVYSVSDFVRFRLAQGGDGERIIVLFRGINDVFRAHRMGFSFRKINVGNVLSENGVCCISPATVLNKSDVEQLEALAEEGVSVEFQCVPRERPVCFAEISRNLKRD